MKTCLTLFLLIACISRSYAQATLEHAVDALTDVKGASYADSTLLSGSEFLSRGNSDPWAPSVIAVQGPAPSEAIVILVKAGARAIPELIQHMDDQRPTKMQKADDTLWTRWNDEYDYNARTQSPPKDVNRSLLNQEHHPKEHQVTVGDLCFVALGQIVNREFSATRYQPSVGSVISSPTYSQRLLKAVRAEYTGMTADQHRRRLLEDFSKPDTQGRRIGALIRLMYYYPDLVPSLVLKQLKVPHFDNNKVSNFVRKELYRNKDEKIRKDRFEAFIHAEGEASRDGIRLQLFDDLDDEIADAEGRLSPPMEKTDQYDARNVLQQLYGYSAKVSSKDVPYSDSWSSFNKADFIEKLGELKNPEVVAEITRIFRAIQDNDALALACMKALKDKGLNAEFLQYCKRRASFSEDDGEELNLAADYFAHKDHSNR